MTTTMRPKVGRGRFMVGSDSIDRDGIHVVAILQGSLPPVNPDFRPGKPGSHRLRSIGQVRPDVQPDTLSRVEQ